MVTPKRGFELDVIFKYLLKGKTKKEIQEKTRLSKTNLSYYLRRLEDFNAIKREGKFIIKVLNPKFTSSNLHPRVTINQVQKGLNKRGHAFNFKLFFSNEKNLLENEKVINEFKKGNLEKLPFGSYKFFRANSTIWINKDSITIYSNNSYYSQNALYSKFKVLQDIDNLAKQLKDRFGFKGVYGIECFREHYGLIFNKFAKWIINKGGTMYVKDNRGKAVLWVDKSRKDDIGLTEFEGKSPITINSADTFFKSHEKHGFKVDADFTLKCVNNLTNACSENAQNLNNYAQHLTAHVKSVQQLGESVKELTKVVKELKKNE
jgi:hypothetical protein